MVELLDFKTEHPQFESLVNKTLLQQGFKTDFQPSFNGSEDVTYMLKKVEENGGKSIHFLIGAKLAAPHHNEAFDFNEDSMFLGFFGSWKSSVLDEASFASEIGLVKMPLRTIDTCAIGGLGYSMSAFSENKDAAWKLIEFLSGEESNRIQAEARIEIPAYLAAQEAYLPAFKHIDGSVFIEQDYA